MSRSKKIVALAREIAGCGVNFPQNSGLTYVPAQWPVIMRCAKKEGNPYNLREMSTEEFYNFKDLSLEMGKNLTKTTTDKKIIWNDIQVIKVDRNSPGSFFYKIDFNDEFGEVCIKESTRQRSSSLEATLDFKKSLHETTFDFRQN